MSESIVTKYETICMICGRPANGFHHLLFGIGKRNLAETDGIKIPICNKHHTMGNITERIHDNTAAEALSKIAGQLAWEKHYIAKKLGIPFDDIEEEAREAFRERFGESYL